MISQDKKGNKLEIAEQWDTRQSRTALGLSAASNTWGQPQTVTKPCLFAYYRAPKAPIVEQIVGFIMFQICHLLIKHRMLPFSQTTVNLVNITFPAANSYFSFQLKAKY